MNKLEESKRKVKNSELKLAGLKQEIVQVTRELSSIYERRDQAKKELIEEYRKAQNRAKELDSREEELSVRRREIEAEREKLKKEALEHIGTIRNLKKEEKELMKQVSRLSSYVLGTDEELKSKSDRIQVLDKKIKDSKIIEEEISRLEKEHASKIQSVDILQKNIGKLKDQEKELITTFNQKLGEIQRKAEIAVDQAVKAQDRNTTLDKEYDKKVKDLDVYIKRAEIVYKKAFPKRIMRL